MIKLNVKQSIRHQKPYQEEYFNINDIKSFIKYKNDDNTIVLFEKRNELVKESPEEILELINQVKYRDAEIIKHLSKKLEDDLIFFRNKTIEDCKKILDKTMNDFIENNKK